MYSVLRGLKEKKNIMAIALLLILLVLPIRSSIYYVGLYYIVVIFLFIPFTFYQIHSKKHSERKFYSKWEKRREKGRTAIIASEGLRVAIIILIIVFGSQFIVNGRTPVFILAELSTRACILLAGMALFFGGLGGVAAWYENEKRYKRMHFVLKGE